MKNESIGSLCALTVTLGFATTALPAAAADDSTLDKISIIGNRTPDYRTQDVEVGPLPSRPIMDLPYSLDVVPDSLSIVQQLKSVRELFRYLPSVQGENIRPQSRGLQAGVV